jgi:hypothetical protein
MKLVLERICRFFSSATLICAALVFCLPWIDVRCDQKVYNDYWNSEGEQMRVYQTSSQSIVTQSGLQAMQGVYTDKQPKFGPPDPNEKALSKACEGAPLVAGYGVLIAIGISTAIAFRRGHWRSLILIACSLGAFLLLFLQTRQGFPISDAVAFESNRLQQDPQFQKESPLMAGPPELTTHLTPFLFAALALPLVAALAAGLNWFLCRGVSVRKPPSGVEMEFSQQPPT